MIADTFETFCHEHLPAWFTERMMHDNWYFGLVMINGDVLVITQIVKIVVAANDEIWIDAKLYEGKLGKWDNCFGHGVIFENRFVTAIHGRLNISINAANVMYAMELANT